MKPRSTLRRALKWIGTLLCVFVLAAFVASLRWDVAVANDRMNLIVWSWGGGVLLLEGAIERKTSLDRWATVELLSPLQSERRFALALRPGWGQGWLHRRDRYVFVPYWIPFALFAIPTAWLWWRDRHRRIPPGHCQKCGYNLTGNVSGRCPECGSLLQANARQSANEPT